MTKAIVSVEVPSDTIRRIDDACCYLKDKEAKNPLSRSELMRRFLFTYLREIEEGMKQDNWVNIQRSAKEILNG